MFFHDWTHSSEHSNMKQLTSTQVRRHWTWSHVVHSPCAGFSATFKEVQTELDTAE